MKRTTILSKGFLCFTCVVAVAAVVAFIYRAALFFGYAGFSQIKDFAADTARAFLLGTRFDLKVITILLLPLVVFIVAETAFKLKLFNKTAQIYSFVILLVYSLLLAGDYLYYGFFETHYNFLIFGLIDDDTAAVLQSIWTDFPVMWILLFIIIFSIVLYKLVAIIYRLPFARLTGNGRVWLIPVLFVPLLFLAVRGRVSSFPLQLREAYFSRNTFVNNLAANPFFTFRDAVKSYRNNLLDIDIDRMLSDAGFFGMNPDSISPARLKQHTPFNRFLKENPPHVIVIQMEGMGLNIMKLDSEKLPVLGSLTAELAHCTVFKNFLPSFEGTIYTMENLLTGTAITPLSETTYINRLDALSTVIPFKEAGYETTFVTGCIKGWRNMEILIPAFGFNNFEAMETILHDIPGAVKQKAWGVFDEYLFLQIENRLRNASSPQFIFGFTITNHTPYETPPHYNIPHFEIDEPVHKLFLKNDDQTLECLHTYRYVCDCLGQFLKNLRTSEYGNNTIVAITGDHSIKGMIKSADSDILDKHGVPFILYVPQQYLQSKSVDTLNWGSHKDIFPTLFNLALSEAEYYPFGIDMFSNDAKHNIAIDFEAGASGNEGSIVNNLYHAPRTSPIQTSDTINSENILRNKVRRIETLTKYITVKTLTKSSNGD